MSQLLLDRFKDYVNIHYSDNNITITDICYDLHCSRSYLHEILIHQYGYSIMRYVEYFRTLKSIELVCKGERKVYLKVGYNSSSVFSKSFSRVTGFNAKCFFPYQFADNKNIIRTAINIATENPKKAIETIIKDVSMKTVLSGQKDKTNSQNKTTTKRQKNKTKRQHKF